jgi:hypothetical protein
MIIVGDTYDITCEFDCGWYSSQIKCWLNIAISMRKCQTTWWITLT